MPRGQSSRKIVCNTKADRIYCGNKCNLPDKSYTRFGTPFECMMKGILIGKLQQQNQPIQYNKVSKKSKKVSKKSKKLTKKKQSKRKIKKSRK